MIHKEDAIHLLKPEQVDLLLKFCVDHFFEGKRENLCKYSNLPLKDGTEDTFLLLCIFCACNLRRSEIERGLEFFEAARKCAGSFFDTYVFFFYRKD
jgi:hypothetical protein